VVTVATIADRILKEAGYEYGVINSVQNTALTIVEYLVEDAIDTINAECGTSIVDLTGALLSKLYLRARQDHGETVGLGPMSMSQSSTDPYVTVLRERLDGLLKRLKAGSIAFAVAEDTSGIE